MYNVIILDFAILGEQFLSYWYKYYIMCNLQFILQRMKINRVIENFILMQEIIFELALINLRVWLVKEIYSKYKLIFS
jgi:hypothetical protein